MSETELLAELLKLEREEPDSVIVFCVLHAARTDRIWKKAAKHRCD